MRHLLLLSFLFAACSSDGQAEADVPTDADFAAREAVFAADGEEPGGETVAEDTATGPVYPAPADPLPVAENGTYTWTDGENKISFAYNDGQVFILESSFGCVGRTGCKVKQDFLKLTCNKAYEKGYFGAVVEGVFKVAGVKTSDTVHGAVATTQSFSLLYELTPTMTCCSDYFNFTAVWSSTDDCSDYAQPDCDPYNDDNCPEGMNCIFSVAEKPVCTAAGEVPAGKECSAQGNCADGVCMGLEGVEGQYCYKYCKTINDCPWGTKCLELGGHQWKVCSLSADEFETCNLLQQNCTEPGDGCYWSSSTITQPVCLPAGEGGGGEGCSDGTDCQKGYDCIANKECRKLCNLNEGQEPTCDSVFTGCSNHYPSQSAGYCGE